MSIIKRRKLQALLAEKSKQEEQKEVVEEKSVNFVESPIKKEDESWIAQLDELEEYKDEEIFDKEDEKVEEPKEDKKKKHIFKKK